MLWGQQRNSYVSQGNERHSHEILGFNMVRDVESRGREKVAITDFAKRQPECIKDQQRAISLVFSIFQSMTINVIMALDSRLR